MTERLEHLFQQTGGDDAPQCVNLGVPGYNIEQARLCVIENHERLAADAVILCCTSNDLEPQSVAPANPGRLYRRTFLNSWLLERSKPLANSLLPRSLRLASRRFEAAGDSETSWRFDSFKLQQGRLAFMQLHKFCQQQNLPLLVVALPSLLEQNTHIDLVGEWCNEAQIPFLELRAALKDHPLGELKVSEFDSHPNRRCHQLFAKALVGPVGRLFSHLDVELQE